MWTFLGIATFTYFYKKCGDFITLANKELLLCVLVFLSLGLVLSYRCRYRNGGLLGRQQSQSHFAAFSDILSALPFIGVFWAKPPAGSEKKEQPESRRVSWRPGGQMNGWVSFIFKLGLGPPKFKFSPTLKQRKVLGGRLWYTFSFSWTFLQRSSEHFRGYILDVLGSD